MIDFTLNLKQQSIQHSLVTTYHIYMKLVTKITKIRFLGFERAFKTSWLGEESLLNLEYSFLLGP